jgi:uncharacterized membrane protein
MVVYGIFDLTNLIVFKKYSASVAFLDIAWGTFLFAITTLLSKNVLDYWKAV